MSTSATTGEPSEGEALRDKHRSDLLEAYRLTVKSLQDTILIQRDEIEYLRAKLDGVPHVSSTRAALNPTQQPTAEEGLRKYLSEEEEDVLALHAAGVLDDFEAREMVTHLRGVPDLEPDE